MQATKAILIVGVTLNVFTIAFGSTMPTCTALPGFTCTIVKNSNTSYVSTFTETSNSDKLFLTLTCPNKTPKVVVDGMIYTVTLGGIEFDKTSLVSDATGSYTIDSTIFNSLMRMSFVTADGKFNASATLPGVPAANRNIASFEIMTSDLSSDDLNCGFSAGNQLASWTSGLASLKIALMEAQSAGQMLNLVFQIHPMFIVLVAALMAVSF